MTDSNAAATLHLPPPEYTTRDDPLSNLSAIRNRVDSLSGILSDSVNGNTPLSKSDSDTITAELTTAIHHIVINGAALVSSSASFGSNLSPKLEGEDFEIVELDVMELITSDNCHVCEFCGKGFKRDANLRMHMRAHGDKFKSPESLLKPDNLKISDNYGPKTRFSCPYVGCSKNRKHQEFRPLKSVACMKNHFKRSHCPKKFRCNRCNNKCFSLLSDLKSHMKHCVGGDKEDDKWRCSCGRMFSRKEELFEHMGMFEGHMPISGNSNNNSNGDVVERGDDNGDDEWLKEMGLWTCIEEIANF